MLIPVTALNMIYIIRSFKDTENPSKSLFAWWLDDFFPQELHRDKPILYAHLFWTRNVAFQKGWSPSHARFIHLPIQIMIIERLASCLSGLSQGVHSMHA